MKPSTFALLIAAVAPGSASAQLACDERTWSSIGVAAFHCPGGNCAFLRASPRGTPQFVFSTEPWLRGVDRSGPAKGRLEEGDVLVAVNDLLITTPAGGTALARLDATRDATLTVRRGDRLVHVLVRPVQTCDGPTMLVGNTVAQPATAREAPVAGESRVPIIDFTVPQRVGNGVDQGLGMTLRCPGCSMIVSGGTPRWAVREWPVVERVVRGGVAWEAGLRAGDEIRRINGRDVRSATGNSPILTPPGGDFEVDAARRGAILSTTINRRIHIQIIHQRQVIRIERDDDRGWGSRTLGAFARFWKGLTGADDTGPPARILVRGETWGPPGLGILLRSDDEALFEIGRGEGDTRASTVRFRAHPVVAEVMAGGAGAAAGLAVGDAITHVNGTSVLEPDGARALLFPRTGVELSLTYVRANRTHSTRITPTDNR